LQKSKKETANLLFATHAAKEIDIQKALESIKALDFIKSKPVMIRIED